MYVIPSCLIFPAKKTIRKHTYEKITNEVKGTMLISLLDRRHKIKVRETFE